MKTMWRFRVIVVLAMLLASSAAHAEERLALLVGNSRYQEATPLRNPENDIEVVGKSLEAVGFAVTRIVNADQAQLSAAIDRFVAEASKIDRPVVLLYFAGHGIQRDGKNYLLPVDAKVASADELAATAINLDALLDRLSAIAADLRLVVLDACRDDPFESASRGAAALAPGLARVEDLSGELIAFSTAPGRVASDGDTGTSPYAAAFAETVLTPGLGVRDVFDRVRQKVQERTRGKQVPWESSALYSEFHFVPPAAAVEMTEIEALLWDNVALLDSAESYQRYVSRFPQGRFAAIAKQKIENINKDFSFRKNAETFEILQDHDRAINFCKRSDSDTVSTGFDNLNFLFRWQDQLVYVDFLIPLKNILCLTAEMDTLELEAVTSEPEDCYKIIGFSTDEPRYSEECVTRPSFAPKKDWMDHLVSQGGLVVRQDSQGLYLSAIDKPFYRYQAWDAEGSFDEAAVIVKGLVRVQTYAEEIFGSYFLEPVDPAELGLSWKFNNTVDAYSSGRDTGAKVTSLSALRAETDAESRAEAERRFAASNIEWDFVGGIATMTRVGDQVSVVYRDFSAPPNAKSSLLFEGAASGEEAYRGTAYVYTKGCKRVAYEATATLSLDDWELVIDGQSPTLNSKCRRVGTAKEPIVLYYRFPDEATEAEGGEDMEE